MNRRDFLAVAAASPMASAFASPRSKDMRMPVVDTHVHCFAGPNSERFPYHPLGPYQPTKIAPPERLLELMDAAGVDFAAIVHPEPYHDDHRYLEHCLDVGKGRLKGVCHFVAEADDAVRRLTDLVTRRPGQIVALRVHAYAPERLPKFDSPELRGLCKAAADRGLALQLHFEPRYAIRLQPLIADFPDAPVLIDHLGRPFQGTAEEYQTVLRWSEWPNVSVKLSSLPVTWEYPHRDVTPIVKQLVAAYGADRLIYGGGFSADASGDSYRAARNRVASQLASLTVEDQAKVLGGNAAKLFGFA
jgi:predicted TIM-barrel fold metal-dependent hydrolase